MSFLKRYYFNNLDFAFLLKKSEDLTYFNKNIYTEKLVKESFTVSKVNDTFDIYHYLTFGVDNEEEYIRNDYPFLEKKDWNKRLEMILEKEIININKKERDLEDELSKISKLDLLEVNFDTLDRFLFIDNFADFKSLYLYFEELKTRSLFLLRRMYGNEYIKDFYEKYETSFFSPDNTIIIKVKNNVSNSSISLLYDDFILYHTSIGRLSKNHKEEKYGNWILSKKIQRYIIIYKWMIKDIFSNIEVECHGIKRYFRASLGHLTQYIVKISVRFKKMLRRYVGWILKFARIALKRKRIARLTRRQKRHTFFLYVHIILGMRKLLIMSQLRILKSYAHSREKVRKRKSKYSFGY